MHPECHKDCPVPVCLSASLGTAEPRAQSKPQASLNSPPPEFLPAQSRKTRSLDLHIFRLGAANRLSAPRVSQPVSLACDWSAQDVGSQREPGGCFGGRRRSREGCAGGAGRAHPSLAAFLFPTAGDDEGDFAEHVEGELFNTSSCVPSVPSPVITSHSIVPSDSKIIKSQETDIKMRFGLVRDAPADPAKDVEIGETSASQGR